MGLDIGLLDPTHSGLIADHTSVSVVSGLILGPGLLPFHTGLPVNSPFLLNLLRGEGMVGKWSSKHHNFASGLGCYCMDSVKLSEMLAIVGYDSQWGRNRHPSA